MPLGKDIEANLERIKAEEAKKPANRRRSKDQVLAMALHAARTARKGKGKKAKPRSKKK